MGIYLPPIYYHDVVCKQMDNFMSFPLSSELKTNSSNIDII